MPRRDRDRYEDEDDRPRRKKGNTALVVVLSVLGGMAAVSLACCGGCYFLSRGGKSSPDPADVRTVAVGDSVTVGDLVVNVEAVKIGPWEGFSPSGAPHMTREPMAVVILKVTSTNPTKVAAAKGAAESAKLRDDLGNQYDPQEIIAESGFKCRINGQLGRGSHEVYADKPITDALVFARPVPAATRLYLTVDAACYGGKGTITFEAAIPQAGPK